MNPRFVTLLTLVMPTAKIQPSNLTIKFTSLCQVLASAESSTKMSFTITRNLEQLPSYPMLCKLAGQNDINVTGSERIGSFSGRGVEGDYEFSEDGMRGKFAGHGITGEFSIASGRAAVTVTDKPFWLPETLLKQKLTDGLDKFCDELS
jgi:hypothetical protein